MKQNRYTSLIIVIIAVLLMTIVTIFNKSTAEKSDYHENIYQIEVIKKAEPIHFKGLVQPARISNLFLDSSLGVITNLSVVDGQEVKEKDVIATYQNVAVENQATEHAQSLDKLHLAVSNAQENLDRAVLKQQELQDRLTIAESQRDSVDTKSHEFEAKKSELELKVEQSQQALEAQKDVVVQATQALESTGVELSSTNTIIEQSQKKVTQVVTSAISGIVHVDEKGRADSSVPYAVIVSPETIIKGTVTEYDYKKIKKDQQVTIRPMSEKKEITGVITMIDQLPETFSSDKAQSADKNTVSNYSFTVAPKENLNYGYTVQIVIPSDTLEIPKKSILKQSERTFIFLYKSGKVYKKKVKVKEGEKNYIVEEGLEEKDQIVVNPDKNLKQGQEVKKSD